MYKNIVEKAAEITRQLGMLGFLSGCEHPPEPRPEKLPCMAKTIKEGLEKGGLDILGVYRSRKNEIAIDYDKCEKVADEFHFPPEDIVLIVLIHELAHFVTHKGLGHALNEWHEFSLSHWHEDSRDMAEQTAQALTYLWLLKWGSKEKTEVFQKLSDLAPQQYREWEKQMKDKEFDRAWADNVLLLHRISGRHLDSTWKFEPSDANTINNI